MPETPPQPPDPPADPPAKRSTRSPRKSTRPKAEPWKPKFLAALKTVPNVRHACEEADIDRALAYRQRQRDEAFAVAWADALEEGLDAMERIAHVRATAGQRMTKTVTRKMANGDVETTTTSEQHISDILLMFMLKRYRPEFRESFRVENTGPDGGPMQHEVTRVDEAAKAFYARLDELGQPDAE